MKIQDLFETIKIGGRKEDENVKAMLDEYWSGTQPHPFDRHLRIWGDDNNMVGVTLYSVGTSEVHLSTIMTFSDKNSGSGSKALKWICDLADKHGVKLTLSVSPIKNAGSRNGKDLNKRQLTAWYAKYGFVKQHGDEMFREPIKTSK